MYHNFTVQRKIFSFLSTINLPINNKMNLISPLLTDFENEKQVRMEVVHLDQLFVKVPEAHDAYLKASDDDDEIKLALEWFGTREKDVLQLK